jgi:hypothetical protein
LRTAKEASITAIGIIEPISDVVRQNEHGQILCDRKPEGSSAEILRINQHHLFQKLHF